MGDSLKVRWKVSKRSSSFEYNPADMYVELNGQEIKFCRELRIHFSALDGAPSAVISFGLDDLDIDMDTLIALEAVVKRKEENAL